MAHKDVRVSVPKAKTKIGVDEYLKPRRNQNGQDDTCNAPVL